MKTYFYMLSLCLYGTGLFAQSPGGVGGPSLKMWIKADAGTSSTGTALDSWTYQNDGTKTFTATGAARPTLTANAVNFKPGITFGGTQFMDGPVGANSPLAAGDDDYSVFGVWTSTSATPGVPQRVWSQRLNSTSGNRDGVGLWLYNGNYGNQAEIGGAGGFVHLTTRSFATGWNITGMNLLSQATNDFSTIDDRNFSTGGAAPITTDPETAPAFDPIDGADWRILANTQNRLGARMDPSTPGVPAVEEPFIGSLSEMIVYDRPITDPNERTRIFSYLAIKYGVSLNSDLLSSSGATVWNNSLMAGYTNAVFGIGQDNGSGLNSTQSNSLATANEMNVIVSNPSGLQDGEFYLIGHDGGDWHEGNGEVPNELGAPGLSKRINRKWLVQQTGLVGSVTVTFDLNNSTFTGNNSVRNFWLVVDTDGDNDLSTGPRRYVIPSSLINNQVSFNFELTQSSAVLGLITNASTALPVTWKSFTGDFRNGKVNLDWTVDNNEKGDRYEVERSTDGNAFKVIGTVKNNPEVKSYSFSTDNYANGVNHYRVHQIDLDGQDIYSKVISIDINSGSDFGFKVMNNPVRTNTLKLQVHSANAVKAAVEIWSLNGVQVLNQQQTIDAGTSTVTVPLTKVPAGSYVVKIRQNGTVRTAGIIKL